MLCATATERQLLTDLCSYQTDRRLAVEAERTLRLAIRLGKEDRCSTTNWNLARDKASFDCCRFREALYTVLIGPGY